MRVVKFVLGLISESIFMILCIYGALSLSDDIIFFLSYGSMDIIRNSIMEIANLMGHPL